MPNEQLDQREGGGQRKSRERRGAGVGVGRVTIRFFRCSRCVCVDRTLLYLHKARAGRTLRDGRRCTEEDFLEWPTASDPRDITFPSDGRHQIPSPCCDFSLISSVSCQFCQAKQICRTSERKKKKRGGGAGTFWNKAGHFFPDERNQERRKAEMQCDTGLLKGPASLRSETAERQFYIRMGRAERRRVQ